jgi:Phage protein (N4 Gp49/phage Sf6 gene 66) family
MKSYTETVNKAAQEREAQRADGGNNIYTKHTGIETDEERAARTDLSSTRMTDDASKAVQQTENRVTLDSMRDKIASEQYIHPAAVPHMTICVMVMDNGFAVVGKSAPADAANYNEGLGQKFAREDCIRQLWQLEGYALRERLAADKSS